MFLGIELMSRLDPERSETDQVFAMMSAMAQLAQELLPKVLPDPAKPLASSWQGSVQELFSKCAVRWPNNLALKDDGTVIGWGNNGYGQISIPTGLVHVVALAAGDYHSAALRSEQ